MAIAFKVSRWCLSGFIAVNLIGCTPWTVLSQQENLGTTRQPIASLGAVSPGVEVYVQGTVTQRVPLLNQGAYELQDSTGRIWVITETPLPEPGAKLAIAGQLQFHELQLQQQDFGEFFIQEQAIIDTVEEGTISPPQLPIKEHLDLQFLPHKGHEKS